MAKTKQKQICEPDSDKDASTSSGGNGGEGTVYTPTKQIINFKTSEKQKNILDLEKKYFEKIKTIIDSDVFKDDLLLIEKEIHENYHEYETIWDLKNKIKVPAERVVRHHIYKQLNNEIKGVYPSPVSSDIGIRMDDCVICIDIKTIDTKTNSTDIKSTTVEKNQTSFDNSDYPYLGCKGNLKSFDHYTSKPVLTYIVKIIYRDDNSTFTLSREEDKPTLILTCIPNGELSALFKKDIIENIKVYKYYLNEDDEYYDPYIIDLDKKPKEEQMAKLTSEFDNRPNFIKLKKTRGVDKRVVYLDASKHIVWWYTKLDGKKGMYPVKCIDTVRYYNSVLRTRYDSKNVEWCAYYTKVINDKKYVE